MDKKFTVGLTQTFPRLGDVQANLERHLELVREAQGLGVDLLIFPELSLTGYTLRELVPHVAVHPSADHPIWKPLLEASARLALVVGFVEEDSRHRFFVSSAFLDGGRVVHIHRKVYLPTYGIFDEKRYFAAGDSFHAFETRFGRAGILICEDFWHVSSPYALWLDGADLFLMTSASPGRGVTDQILGSAQWVQDVNRAYSGLFTAFFAHANRVGFEDGLNFFGGSTVFDPDGRMLARAPFNEEALTLCEIDLAQLRRTRTRLPLLRDERPEILLKALQSNGK